MLYRFILLLAGTTTENTCPEGEFPGPCKCELTCKEKIAGVKCEEKVVIANADGQHLIYLLLHMI